MEAIHRLRDPRLVAAFQQFCGVSPIDVTDNGTPKNGLAGKGHSNGFTASNGTTVRNKCNGNGVVNGNSNHSKKPTGKEATFIVKNVFFYYLFSVGAELGNEMFYCIFFPYWFWNVDGYVCRRLILVWCMVMYVGQAAKDVIRWPRPQSPPVVRLEARYVLEYGMPSTHAMIGFAFPISLVLFTYNRYVELA